MKPRSFKHNLTTCKRGQSLLEFAVGILVLLVLFAGLVDVGRAVFTYITYRDAAQEAASFGSVYPTFCIQIVERALSSLPDPGSIMVDVNVDGVDCSVATPQQACLGNTIEVVITDPNFTLAVPFLGPFIGGNTFTLTASVDDTIIRTPCNLP